MFLNCWQDFAANTVFRIQKVYFRASVYFLYASLQFKWVFPLFLLNFSSNGTSKYTLATTETGSFILPILPTDLVS